MILDRWIVRLLFLVCLSFLAGCGGGSGGSAPSGPSGRLAFLNGNQTVTAGACSKAVQLQTQDNNGNPVSPSSALNLNLSSTSAVGGNVSFYSDQNCTQRIKTEAVPASSSSSSSFYFLRNVASNSALTINATDPSNQYATASQTITIARNPAFSTVWDSPNLPAGVSTGVIDVKTYCTLSNFQAVGATCAAGNGTTDDTQAILQAVHYSVGSTSARATDPTSTRDSTIYFPSGTYLVSKPILWQDGSGKWVAFLSFQGENNSDTILKFADGTPGSTQSPSCWAKGISNSVLYTASDGSTDGAAQGAEGGEGGDAFRNNIRNLTIDTGKNNPNMIGIDYAGSNDTAIRDVNIVSGDGQGCVGLNEYRYSEGPELFSDLFIQGFDTGIYGAGEINQCGTLYGAVRISALEHIRIQDQNVAGINLPGMAEVSVRELTSDNSVPAVTATNPAGIYSNNLSLVDSSLGGGQAPAAIMLQQASGAVSLPYTFVRNVTSSGYGALSNQKLQALSSNEFSSQAPLLGTEHSSTSSLDLSIAETPLFADDTSDGTNYASWSFPAIPSGCSLNSVLQVCDLTAALQTAIDNASSTVVIPWGWYGLSAPLMVGGGHGMNVKRILCLGCHLVAMASPSCPQISNVQQYPDGCNNQEALIIGDTNNPTLWIEGLLPFYDPKEPGEDPFHFGYSQEPYPSSAFVPVFLNTTNKTSVVLLDLDNITYLDQPSQATGPFSPLYLESVAYGPFVFLNRQVWARNLDPEVAPASPQFLACNTGSGTSSGKCGTTTITNNEPMDFLQQGNSHAIVSQTSVQNGASLWALGFKAENREEPAVCLYEHSGGDVHDGAGLAANSLLEVDDGAKAEVIGLQSYDHRLNSIDVNGQPVGAVVSNTGLSALSPISVEGFFAVGTPNQEYNYNVQQLYPDGTQFYLYQFEYCATHTGVLCSYSNGANTGTGAASAFPIYVGH
jgi:Pectate lyase superfamily protein